MFCGIPYHSRNDYTESTQVHQPRRLTKRCSRRSDQRGSMRSKETRLLSMFQPFSLKVEKSFASNAREVDICQSDPIGDNPVTRRFRTKHFAAGLLVQSNCTTLGGLPMTRPLHVFGIALATRPVQRCTTNPGHPRRPWARLLTRRAA